MQLMLMINALSPIKKSSDLVATFEFIMLDALSLFCRCNI